MAATSAVCQEKSEPASCFHTGTPFCPDFISCSFCIRTSRIASASIGRLLEIARINICGPIASDGSSRATCWNWSLRLFVFLVMSSTPAVVSRVKIGVEPIFFLSRSRLLNSIFNVVITPCSAWISATCASVFTPADIACLSSFCISTSSFCNWSMIILAYWPILPRLPSTDRIPLSVLSSSSISSLTGSIYPPNLVWKYSVVKVSGRRLFSLSISSSFEIYRLTSMFITSSSA